LRDAVHESAHHEFIVAITDYAEALEIGPGLDDPDMCPHLSKAEIESTLDYVEVS
jgi:aldehyde dehydrogenase (NAD+)